MTWFVTPATVWILNRLGSVADAVGLGPRLEPDALKRRAARRARLSDFGDSDFEAPLALVCRSFTEEAHLSFLGRIIAAELLTSALVSRLRWADLRRRGDARLEAPLNRPIIVAGLPRSGTTLLHRILSEMPGTRPIQTWELTELMHPPSRSVAWIKWQTRNKLRVIRNLAPELDIKHLFGADEPEEEVSLFDASMWTPTFWRFGLVRSYLDWYLTTDPQPGYRIYADILRFLQAQTPERRLVLKMPNHTGYLDVIRAILPEAILIQTHRDPAPIVASYTSLMRSMHRVSAEQWDDNLGGTLSLRLWAHHADRCLQGRQGMPEGAVIDVQFSELVEDLEGAVRRILEAADVPVPDDLAERAQRHRDRKGPKHVYALEDFGLSEAQVHERFAAYRERFL